MLYLANLPYQNSHETQGRKRLSTPFPIQFNNLFFTYPTPRAPKTLNNVNLTLKAGTCTAIAGPSRSGKSTIASILLGLYPPDPDPDPLHHAPPLTFSGIPSSECNIRTLRSFIGIVQQTPLLFPSSIYENIIYGLPEGSPFATLTASMHAAEEAGIHELIMTLEHGYYTVVGDDGMGLSGGQTQRIAVARALVRRPKLLVLDEATSALDTVSAEAIRETIRKLMERGRESEEGGIAVLIISHNVEMMRIADEVVVVERGCIVEAGSFRELRGRGGRFSALIGVKRGEMAEERPRAMTPVVGRSR
jgi:ATP-binding cassette, subfamily B (MDR/TAP), member 1